ncbi:MAG: 2Fe-2S iron-sulfur cluster-binding protein [Pseudomonadota bacterium]
MTKIIFITETGEEHAVDAADGETAMEAAVTAGIDGILAECGGGCACGTCHVYVDTSQMDVVGEPDLMEKAMLDFAEAAQENSRLSCQITVTDALEGLRLTVATQA